MNEDIGLAQQAQSAITIEQVIEMLMQGMNPDEMLAMGVPEQMLIQAIQILQSQEAPEESAEGMGLAGMSMRRNDSL